MNPCLSLTLESWLWDFPSRFLTEVGIQLICQGLEEKRITLRNYRFSSCVCLWLWLKNKLGSWQVPTTILHCLAQMSATAKPDRSGSSCSPLGEGAGSHRQMGQLCHHRLRCCLGACGGASSVLCHQPWPPASWQVSSALGSCPPAQGS